jgi:type III secretion system (T3SS) SseB-like protein
MNIRFIGEKDGPTERELKETLGTIFSTIKDVQRAYLATVDYLDEQPPSVMLCLCTAHGDSVELVTKIQEIFTPMFSSNEHLDVCFITEMEEIRLMGVCRPFYIGAE